MKQTLSLRLGQQLAMTPQLQQAIRLMQLSALELKLEVRQAAESNPMLEMLEDADETVDGADEDIASEPDSLDDFEQPDEDDESLHLEAQEPRPVNESTDTIPEDLPVDVSWDDVYQPSSAITGSAGRAEPDAPGFEERSSAGQTLVDHLLWQLNLTPSSDRDRLAAITIIDSIDENGMLTADLGDLLATLPATLGFAADEMEAVLKLVQRFDPPGVGARNLAECLLLQLEQLPEDVRWRDHAVRLVRDCFALLGKGDFGALARRARLADDELGEVLALIRSLNPRPGAAIGEHAIEYIEPDVVVARKNGRWTVELNPETAPPVRIHRDYAGLVQQTGAGPEMTYLKNSLQDAKWFLKNLAYRNETLLAVATNIVERQRGFLEHGEEAMRPLVLADIANAVDRHESTISRVTTRKYMATPRGVFELKYFFSSHVGTATGGEVSSTAIRALIRKLTDEEDPRKPFSDSKIATLLGKRNIRVARRTVAKYRESLAIPPSNERKRLA